MINPDTKVNWTDVSNLFSLASGKTTLSGSPYTNIIYPTLYNYNDTHSIGDIVNQNGFVFQSTTSSNISPPCSLNGWITSSVGYVTYAPGNSYVKLQEVVSGSGIYLSVANTNTSDPATDTTNWKQLPLKGMNKLTYDTYQWVQNAAFNTRKYNWLQSVAGENTYEMTDVSKGFPITTPDINFDNQYFYYPDDTGIQQSITMSNLSDLYGMNCKYTLQTLGQASGSGPAINHMEFDLIVGGDVDIIVTGSLTFTVYYQSPPSPGTMVLTDYITPTIPVGTFGMDAWNGATYYRSAWINFNNEHLTANTTYNFSFDCVLNNYAAGHEGTSAYIYPQIYGAGLTSQLFSTGSSIVKGIHNKYATKKIAAPHFTSGSGTRIPSGIFTNNYSASASPPFPQDPGTGYNLNGSQVQWVPTNPYTTSYTVTFTDFKPDNNSMTVGYTPSCYGRWFGMTPPVMGVPFISNTSMNYNKIYFLSASNKMGNVIDLTVPPVKLSQPYTSYLDSFSGNYITSLVYTASFETNSTPQVWFPYTVYPVGYQVLDSNGNIQTCKVSGMTNSSPPSWATTWNGTSTEGRDTYFSSGQKYNWANTPVCVWNMTGDYGSMMTPSSSLISGSTGAYESPARARYYSNPIYPAISISQSWQPTASYVQGQRIMDNNGYIRYAVQGGISSGSVPNWGTTGYTTSDPATSPNYGIVGLNNYITDGTVIWSHENLAFNPTNIWIYRIAVERCSTNTGAISVDIGQYRNGSYVSLGTYSTGQSYPCMFPIWTNTPLVYNASEPVNVMASLITNSSIWDGTGTVGYPIAATAINSLNGILGLIT